MCNKPKTMHFVAWTLKNIFATAPLKHDEGYAIAIQKGYCSLMRASRERCGNVVTALW